MKFSIENIFLETKIKIQHRKTNSNVTMLKSATFRIKALQAKQHFPKHLFSSDLWIHTENTVHSAGLWAVVSSFPQPVLFTSGSPFQSLHSRILPTVFFLYQTLGSYTCIYMHLLPFRARFFLFYFGFFF